MGSAAADVNAGGIDIGLGGLGVQVPGVSVPAPGVEVDVPEVSVQLGQDGSAEPEQPTPGGQPETPPAEPETPPADPGETPADPGAGETPSGSGEGAGSGEATGSGSGGDSGRTPGSGGSQDGDGGGSGGEGSEAGAAQPTETADEAEGGEGGSDGGDPTEEDAEPTLSTRAGDLIAEIPSGILVALALITILGLLMTGRSAWFARATRRLRIQRLSLQEDVGALQAALVPELPATIAGVELDVVCSPARGPGAGGEFHDAFELGDGRLGLVLGDISGRGREAVPKTGIVRFTLRAYLEAGYEPRAAVRMTDRALGPSFGDDFATAIAAVWDPALRRLVYSCAGHPKPIVIGSGDLREVDVLGSPPIGMGHASGTRQTTVAIAPGSRIWFFSDGLSEAHGPGERPLGRGALRRMLEDDPDPAGLLAELPGIEAPSRDDVTVMRMRPAASDEVVDGSFSVEALLVQPTHGERSIGEFLAACGLAGEDLEGCQRLIAAERRQEGQVLVRVSRIDDAVHWRVARIDPDREAAAAAVPAG